MIGIIAWENKPYIFWFTAGLRKITGHFGEMCFLNVCIDTVI